MHANVVVDDELQARQAHALVGQLAKVKGELGVAHVHHDLDGNLGHQAALHFRDFGLQQAVVNKAGVALGAAHRHQHAFFKRLGGMAAADHGRNAQLARNDGGVAGAPAAVGHDGRSALHDRLPIGVGHIGHEHVAGLHRVHLADVVDDAHRAGADFLPNGTAFDQHGGAALELVAVFHRVGGLAFDGLRARLQDVQLAVDAVLAPFDVHGPAVMVFNHQRVAGELLNVGVGQRVAVAQLGGHVGGFDQLGASGLFLQAGELHLQQLGAQAAADHRALARTQHGFVHVKLVRVDGALHHGFAQTVARGNKHHVRKTRFGVDGEHDTGRTQVRAHHALDTGAQSHMLVGKALVHAVADGAVVVERGKYFADLVQHVFNAQHVQKRFLLTGERGVGQVFGRGRRAHGKGRSRVARTQCLKCRADALLQIGRERLHFHHGADLSPGHGQGAHVLDIERAQARVDAAAQVLVGQKGTKSVRRGGKAGRHFHAFGQLGNHFAQAGVFAAHGLDVAHAKVLKRHDPIGVAKKIRHYKTPKLKIGPSLAPVRALRVAVVAVLKAKGVQNGPPFGFVVLAFRFCHPGGLQGEL